MGRVIVVFVSLLLLMSGCKSKEYVTVEKSKTDTLYINKVQLDSVIVTDSVSTVVRGDTIFRDRWHTFHTYRYVIDTLYQAKIYREPQPYEVVKTVEVNKLKWWQTVLIWIGALSLFCFCWIVFERGISHKT